jgi:hypothetical protein
MFLPYKIAAKERGAMYLEWRIFEYLELSIGKGVVA